jgi:hypothetical protein
VRFIEPRPFTDPDAAARKLVKIANGVEAVQDGRIYIEPVNAPFLAAGRSGEDFRAGTRPLCRRPDWLDKRARTILRMAASVTAGPRRCWGGVFVGGRDGKSTVPSTYSGVVVTIVQCKCGAEYKRTEEKFLVPHTGNAICAVCGAALES